MGFGLLHAHGLDIGSDPLSSFFFCLFFFVLFHTQIFFLLDLLTF
jgi:hypothetical protein